MKTSVHNYAGMKQLMLIALIGVFGSAQATLIFKTSFEATYFVGGDSTDAGVVLQLNQNPNFNINQVGAFVFPTALETGESYTVNLINAPLNKSCVVENASGSINQADVLDVNVFCGTNTTIYDVKQNIITGLVAIDDIQIISCWPGRGLTAQTLPSSPAYVGDDYSGVYIVDNTTDCSDQNENPQVGDQVRLVGYTNEFFGQIQIIDPHYAVISSDNNPATPVSSTTGALGTLVAGPLDAVLVQVTDVTVTDVDVPPVTGDTSPTNEYIVTDDMSSELRIDDLLYLTTPFPALNDGFSSLTGIMTFRLQHSKLLPRYSADAFIADPLANNLVINEVDYNQINTDTNEFIELFNPTAQTISLSNKTVYLVNGSSSSEYLSVDLDGYGEMLSGQYLVIGSQNVLDDINNGSIEVPFLNTDNNIQNGPDGILLIDRVTEVVEDVLSYQGSVTAVISELNDLVVPLVEGTATNAVDNSTGTYALARVPNGSDSDDALTDWQSVGNTTPGVANQINDLNLGGLVINEVDYDQPMTDSNEFIEILNSTGLTMDLSGISLYLINQSGSVYLSIDLSAISLDGGEYLVVGSDGVVNSLPQGTQSIAFANPDNNIQNGGSDGILLFDDVNAAAVDALSYEGSLTAVDVNGTVVNLVEGTATSVQDTNDNVGSMVRFPNGQDTDDASNDWSFTSIITPGADNQ